MRREVLQQLVVTVLWATTKRAVGNGGHDMYGNPLPDLWPTEEAMTASGELGDVTATIPLWKDLTPEEKARTTAPYSPPKDWRYNTSSGPVEGMINVHLVPHSHDDVGWQVTVDQYFYREVFYIYDTLLERLEENPDRKFIPVEIGFFARWWDELTEEKRERTRKLVQSGQFEFINGGWAMHDEAAPTYVEMADNTMRGHQFLVKNLNATPRGTWQVDPFGHTSTQAWLLSYEAGMDSLFWGRMDWQDREMRYNATESPVMGFEWIWQGADSLPDAKIFAGDLYGRGVGGYATWIGFNDNTQQIQDDPQMLDYNVDYWVDTVVQDALSQAEHTVGDHQLWACGSDFQYQNSDLWFRNTDKLIHYANLNGTVNFFYSTPTIYADAKKWQTENQADFQLRANPDDVMPLADDAHNYWTGYFTSRPALKRQVRKGTNLLATVRMLEILANVSYTDVLSAVDFDVQAAPRVGDAASDGLEGALALATHHDGVSGTERQSVTDDYSLRMAQQAKFAEVAVSLAIAKLAGATNASDVRHCNCNGAPHETCLNASVCAATASSDDDDENGFTVYAWNNLAAPRTETLRLPVTTSSLSDGSSVSWACSDAAGSSLQVQLLDLDQRTLDIPLLYLNEVNLTQQEIIDHQKQLANTADSTLAVRVALPALGLAALTCAPTVAMEQPGKKLTPGYSVPSEKKETTATTRVVSNGYYEVTVNATSIVSLKNVETGVETDFAVTWGWYNSSVGGCTEYPSELGANMTTTPCSDQKSGAYIFRPNSSELFGFDPAFAPTLDVVTGDLVTEIRQVISPFTSHVVRLYADEPLVEIEWTAGPIPIDTPWFAPVAYDANDTSAALPNNWGKELVLKLETGLETASRFAVDSNAREMIQRVRDKRGPTYPDPYLVSEPVAGNYYPATWLAAVNDSTAELAVAVDASLGVASIHDGELEFMVHRRLQADDSRGVQEPLNETMCGCNDINAAPGDMGQFGHEGDGGCLCQGLTVRGSLWLALDEPTAARALRRQLALRLNYPPSLAFGPGCSLGGGCSGGSLLNFSALSGVLPTNVQLTTLTANYRAIHDGALVLRFAHLYQVGEHPTLAQPATLNLTALFSKSPLNIRAAKETTLTANQPRNRDSFDFPILTISPMEVRTFLAWFD